MNLVYDQKKNVFICKLHDRKEKNYTQKIFTIKLIQ